MIAKFKKKKEKGKKRKSGKKDANREKNHELWTKGEKKEGARFKLH